MKAKMKGYTISELLFVICFFGTLALGIAGVIALIHFIMKFW